MSSLNSIKNPMRPELSPLPERMKDLPVDVRGYPVPWFVTWIDNPEKPGELMPEFRAMDPVKFHHAIRYSLCWVCGKVLGTYKCFLIGPMCGINHVSSEPPSHFECARWSVQNCPFLSKPQMVRRESGPGVTPEELEASKKNAAGVMIERNPGVTLIWTVKTFRVFSDSKKGFLFDVGEPLRTEWWKEGRPATIAEIDESIESGLPLLNKVAQGEDDLKEIARRREELRKLYPNT